MKKKIKYAVLSFVSSFFAAFSLNADIVVGRGYCCDIYDDGCSVSRFAGLYEKSDSRTIIAVPVTGVDSKEDFVAEVMYGNCEKSDLLVRVLSDAEFFGVVSSLFEGGERYVNEKYDHLHETYEVMGFSKGDYKWMQWPTELWSERSSVPGRFWITVPRKTT